MVVTYICDKCQFETLSVSKFRAHLQRKTDCTNRVITSAEFIELEEQCLVDTYEEIGEGTREIARRLRCKKPEDLDRDFSAIITLYNRLINRANFVDKTKISEDEYRQKMIKSRNVFIADYFKKVLDTVEHGNAVMMRIARKYEDVIPADHLPELDAESEVDLAMNSLSLDLEAIQESPDLE